MSLHQHCTMHICTVHAEGTRSDARKNNFKTKGITIGFKNKDTITFNAMSEVAKAMHNIPGENQKILHDKSQLDKDNTKYIQTMPRFGFGYNKNNKDVFVIPKGRKGGSERKLKLHGSNNREVKGR